MARAFTDNSANRVATGNTSRFDLAAFSIAFWIRRTVTTPTIGLYILGADDGNVDSGWFIDNNLTAAKLQLVIVHSTVNVRREMTNAVALNAWDHVVAIWDGNTPATSITYYHNGVADAGTGGTAGSGSHVAEAVPFHVGDHSTAPSGAFPCRLAEIGIWNRVITANEALILSGRYPPNRITNGLVGYFPLYGAGTEPELTGSGLTGTVTDATQADHAPVAMPFGFDLGWSGAFAAAGLAVTPLVGSGAIAGVAGLMGLGVPTRTTIRGQT